MTTLDSSSPESGVSFARTPTPTSSLIADTAPSLASVPVHPRSGVASSTAGSVAASVQSLAFVPVHLRLDVAPSPAGSVAASVHPRPSVAAAPSAPAGRSTGARASSSDPGAAPVQPQDDKCFTSATPPAQARHSSAAFPQTSGLMDERALPVDASFTSSIPSTSTSLSQPVVRDDGGSSSPPASPSGSGSAPLAPPASSAAHDRVELESLINRFRTYSLPAVAFEKLHDDVSDVLTRGQISWWSRVHDTSGGDRLHYAGPRVAYFILLGYHPTFVGSLLQHGPRVHTAREVKRRLSALGGQASGAGEVAVRSVDVSSVEELDMPAEHERSEPESVAGPDLFAEKLRKA